MTHVAAKTHTSKMRSGHAYNVHGLADLASHLNEEQEGTARSAAGPTSTVIIIGQEGTTTTSDPSTATLLHIRLPRQNSASTDMSRAGEKSPGGGGPGLIHSFIHRSWPAERNYR